MEDCIFCKIRDGEIESDVVYQDEVALAFRDLNPQAPTHLIIIPKKHIGTMNEVTKEQRPLLGHLLTTGAELAKKEGFAEDGYRLVLNCNRHGGQSVFHIHLHLLGGRQLRWPPG